MKVVLSGEGADEIFGGYVRYVPLANERAVRASSPSYGELFDKIYDSQSTTYARLSARTSDSNYMKKLMEPYFAQYDPITAMQLFDFKYILPSLLQMGDRMASAFGIENRCPFLDRRLIEFGLSLPPHLKIQGTTTKVMLRRVLAKRGLPTNGEKHGLIVAFNKWHGIAGYGRSKYFEHLTDIWRSFR